MLPEGWSWVLAWGGSLVSLGVFWPLFSFPPWPLVLLAGSVLTLPRGFLSDSGELGFHMLIWLKKGQVLILPASPYQSCAYGVT